ncbi:hypothetical protein JIG36_06355 [Actinoplanes sp. LDG1-06]|uniref:Uncharacterized protein n=1 Tax=Paractinoplanes ovalisporus TaxID=2810368 RepID=A0ABS2A5S4_9ACTN|nr:hypothetical protein [Actinoplanes ovalisporus]MBM2615183.1 hypothetical protein [Actinoplanes ovalisporus]
MAGSAREEAERLVATVLARAVAGQAFNDRRWATGDAECCVCPVCKAIAAMRDPKPETAARLAGSASDLAGSVASLLRSVSAIVGEKPKPAPPAPAKPGNADQTWSAATRADSNTADAAWSAAINAAEAERAAAAVEAGSGDALAAGDTASSGGVLAGSSHLPDSTDKSDLSGKTMSGAGGGETDRPERSPGRAGLFGSATSDDPWSAATTTSAAEVAREHAAELAERKAAALRAAAEAERRVAEAAALAKARRDAAVKEAAAGAGGADAGAAGGAGPAGGGAGASGGAGGAGGGETGNTAGRAGRGERTARRLDVWAAATADAGVAAVAGGDAVDHDVAGAEASGDEGGGGPGDDARDGDAQQRDN